MTQYKLRSSIDTKCDSLARGAAGATLGALGGGLVGSIIEDALNVIERYGQTGDDLSVAFAYTGAAMGAVIGAAWSKYLNGADQAMHQQGRRPTRWEPARAGLLFGMVV